MGASQRKHVEDARKMARLESDCNRLRALVKKKINSAAGLCNPNSPASVAQIMKAEAADIFYYSGSSASSSSARKTGAFDHNSTRPWRRRSYAPDQGITNFHHLQGETVIETVKDSNSNSDKKKEKNGGQDRGDDGGTGPVDLGAGDHVGDYESSDLENDKDSKRMKADFNELCDEDKILVFFKKLLQEWAQELEERPDTQKRTSRGKSSVATFKQCARYLNPLFKLCRKRVR